MTKIKYCVDCKHSESKIKEPMMCKKEWLSLVTKDRYYPYAGCWKLRRDLCGSAAIGFEKRD